MSERFLTLGAYFKNTYNEKLIKLAIDGGFTCPNRDGTLGTRGCLFCNEYGSGEYAGVIENGVRIPNQSIKKQIESQINLTSHKWKATGYLAYFQNFSNTYAPVDVLKTLYNQAIEVDGVKGLVIATRPDCINDKIVEVFEEYAKNHVFWVELGLQSIHEESLKWLRTEYTLDCFSETVEALKAKNIPYVVHLIAGLKGETKEMFLESIAYINKIKPFGIKLHMLNILQNTDLGVAYKEAPFELLDRETYVDWICTALEYLDDSIVVHRVTGDGIHDDLIAPTWIKDKRKVLNGIHQEMARRNTFQGAKI
jgi:radical SAM protein (TIGR01212 family)